MNRSITSITALACWILLLLPAAASLRNPQIAEDDLEKSCRDFVQKFYDWYVPKASDINVEDPMDLALKSNSSAFSPELLKQLKEENDAKPVPPGQIAGLDFDPFLNSQDPSPRFAVNNVGHKGGTYFAEVFGISSSGRRERVIAELVRKKDHWVFVNFHYPNLAQGTGKNAEKNDDLLTLLKMFRAARQGHPK